MARSAVKRYLVAAFAFMAAAIWFGVGLKNGFACLLVFELALQAARLYQRRSSVHSRRAPAGRERPSSYPTGLVETEAHSMGARRTRTPSSGRVYDGRGQDIRWPVATEATW